jgi:hypothetical protein
MSPKRAVLLMRLAIYGTVLIVAAGVYALRAGPAPDDAAANGGHTLEAQLAGRTNERLPVEMSLVDGEIRRLHVRWQMTCENERQTNPSGISFSSDHGDRFERHGTAFHVGGRETQDMGGGESVLYVVDVSGRVEGNAAEGHGHLTETWFRDGQMVDRCHSDEIVWRVGSGMPAGTLES